MNKLCLALLCAVALYACRKDDSGAAASKDALAPDGFLFQTSRTVAMSVRLLTNNDQPLPGVLVDVYATSNLKSPLFTVISDENGLITGNLNVPAFADTLVIDPAYLGLARNAVAVVRNNAVNGTIGGRQGFSGSIIANEDANGSPLISRYGIEGKLGTTGTTAYSYISSYDASGKPLQMAPSDVISAELLSYVNTSLPEQKPVPVYHPDYLNAASETNLNIEKLADVWITFVHEGAGYYNTLGYYTFPTNRPPQSQADIDTVKIVLPNASMSGSGGSMKSGDKVWLGRFQPGTSVGFVLLQNAWSPTSKTVNTAARKYFSDDVLNNEAAGYKRHAVLLHDSKYQVFLNGFEDLQRDNNSSDNDFNDLVFYATSNPVEAISTQNVNPVDRPVDSDGDGITDTYDRFPKDATKAYVAYYPGADTWGTLAFEDLWPSAGDYDLNDLVLGYQYRVINNAKNNVVELGADFTIHGIGASRKNGFGVQLPVAYDRVSSITGQLLRGNAITLRANGTEAGQAKAVFIPFNDPEALITPAIFVNNQNGQALVKSDTARIVVKFATPITAAELGSAPFNPFLIVNQQRNAEVHLPGNKPTDKANPALFGTMHDRTSVSGNKYYLTEDNWPWALNFPTVFEYPTEANKITEVYTYFQPWARSGGGTNTDWFQNKAGYRKPALVFKR